ncbi:preprotein translocase subunit SecG [Piscinibacter koreensis]|uniref:Protein-export membrane protein SecG n=1 Tax=Piscinibacter koreensis TaxID=2742824 RepID=A0A7Y6NRS1_9BURK|nr:preprotein translocase subunit SecG [Schlegelella koreensis]NUZ08129.1 preprotein translocase subunit SecG [Schlegelella koreensis]
MNVLWNLVLMLQIAAALAMIGLVLIQHGKGADMGASFGSGASGSLFGATGSANFLSRSTAVCAAVFFACTLALAYTSNDRSRPRTGSILERPAIGLSASAPASGAAQVPGAASAPSALPPASASAAAVPAAPAASAAPAQVAPAASGAGAVPQR